MRRLRQRSALAAHPELKDIFAEAVVAGIRAGYAHAPPVTPEPPSEEAPREEPPVKED